MTKASAYADKRPADILEALCPCGEAVEGVEVDQAWDDGVTTITFDDGSAITVDAHTVHVHPRLDRIRAAAAEDLAELSDPVGLQRAAIETVADGRCTAEQARYAAGQCAAAVELRRVFDSFDQA